MTECYNCGSQLQLEDRVFRSTLCPSCGADVRVCLNCRFYSPGSQWDCAESIPEPVRTKDRANFCDYFQINRKKRVDGNSAKEELRSRFDSLFGTNE